MNLLPRSALQTTIGKALVRGALCFGWLGCLLILMNWPNPLHAAPGAAPLAQVGCSANMNVGNTAELNNAIGCYNSQTTAGVYTITFNANITLNITSTVINNPTPGVALLINGNFNVLHGANTYRGLAITPNTHVTINGLYIRGGKVDTDGGGILNSGTLTVTHSQLWFNWALNGKGGGIYNTTTGMLMVSYSDVITNSTNNAGGGIYNAGRLTVSHSSFIGNLALGEFSHGGGIDNAGTGTLTVSDSTLSGNSAELGGGINNNTNGTLTVSNSTLSGNKATAGPGGGIYNNINAPLTVSSSTFSGNSATGGTGGGIASLSPLTVTNSTFSGNSSTIDGGGIYLLGSSAALTLRNTIIANSPSGGDCFSNGGTLTSQTHNLLEDSANACGITNGANSSIIGQDPALAPLARNNGSTLETHALLATSPAIDKGDAATCAAAPINNLDQNGWIRPMGTVCDIGAVEYFACAFPAMVSTTAQFNDAISCYKLQTTAGLYTITFNADITLTTASRTINNSVPGVALQINGNGKALRGANTYRGVAIDFNTHVTIAGLTIRDSKTDTDGGGILNSGTLTLNNSQIISNSASNFGGGIDNFGTLTVTNSTLSGNSASKDGGGIANSGLLNIVGSTLSGNSAASANDGHGGGIYNTRTLNLIDSTLSGNSASRLAGGILNLGTLTVSNSTLSRNSTTGAGGGIYNTDTLTVTRSRLEFNSALNGDGGGIVNAGTGTLTMTSSTLGHNLAPLGAGGGIYNGGKLLVQGTFEGNSAESGGGLMNNGVVTVNGSTFYTNTAKNGGGFYNNITSTLTIKSSSILTNSADKGGGGIVNVGTLTMSNSTLSGNAASNFGGGGILNLGGTSRVDNSTLSGNSTTGDGGGINNGLHGTLAVSNSTLSDNSAESGGGINNNGVVTVNEGAFYTNRAKYGGGLYNNITSTLTVSASTLSDNTASIRGGGIMNSGASMVSNSTLSGNAAINSIGGGIFNEGTLTVTNSTFSDNAAAVGGSAGGGIYLSLSGALTLRNTIIANSPSGGDCFSNGGTLTSQTHNLLEDSANACGITNGANSSIIGQDPALAPLARNNGSTLETHALLATSPAIDQGDAATCAAAPINNRDQNGGIRPQGAACDIGAVEATPPTKHSLSVNKAGSGSGAVTSTPAGIDCGVTCSASFVQGATVTLTATPAAGSTFAEWSGACSGTATCQVTMAGAKAVTATFTSQPVSQGKAVYLPLIRR